MRAHELPKRDADVLVKICGITRRQDAQRAAELGASAVGFIFWPASPRFIDPYRARTIVAELPAFVTPVGVFVNQAPSYVNAVASLVRLGAVQLHGDEAPALRSEIERPIIKAVNANAPGDTLWPGPVTLLVDAHDPVQRGGTGRLADWSAAAQLARHRRVLLAGGLNPLNVSEAVAHVRPFGIDVSSGVESAPGVKDEKLMVALFEALAS